MDLTRRERRKLEVRYRILEAAIALWNEQGIRETKVSEISDRADVAHKTFFNHFPTKQHLLRALAEDALRQILVDIEAVRKQGRTTRERIELFFSSLAENAGDAGPMHRELITELVHALHDSQEESELVRRLHDAFEEIVCDGERAGDLRPGHDVETLTDVVLGTFYSLIFNWAHRDDFPLRERANAAASFLADALGPEEETQ
jgi:AcrR family transcriptional regulator